MKGYSLGLIEMTQLAELEAKKNSTRQFIGRNGRRLSGRLLNAIFSGFNSKSKPPSSFVGTRGIPYGRIHEEGGTIVPVNAKHLWLKNYRAPNKFKRLTPSQFISMMRANPTSGLERGKETFNIIPSEGGLIAARVKNYKTKPDVVEALFFLKKKVKIPKRPYLRPGIKTAMSKFPRIAAKHIRQELMRKLGGK